MSRDEPNRLRSYLHTPLHIGCETDGQVITARLKESPDGELPAGGFGLQLVSSFSVMWGSSTTADGKAVWAVLR